VLGSATLAGGNATVPVRAKALAPGARVLTIAYAGDGVVDPGTGAVTLTVVRARGAIARTVVTPKRVVVRTTRARVALRVAADGVIPTGKVTISGHGLTKRTVRLGAGGRAVVTLPAFKVRGLKKLTVTYLGDRYVRGATTTVTIRVRPRR
jgi:hypothetical protein